MAANKSGLIDPHVFIAMPSEYKADYQNCHLSLRVSDFQISVAVLDIDKNHYIAYENHLIQTENKSDILENKIEEILSGFELLDGNYKSKSVVWSGKTFTLLPNYLFDSKSLEKYIGYLIDSDEKDQLMYDRITSTDIINVYSIPFIIYSVLLNHMPDIKILHHLSVFIPTLINKHGDADYIDLNVRRNRFDIVVFRQKEFLFANTFEYLSYDDILYFLVYICEQFEIKLGQAEVTIYDETSQIDGIIINLKNYFESINIGKIPDESSYAEGISAKGDGITLFSQYQCI